MEIDQPHPQMEMTEQQQQNMEQALQNPLILHKILTAADVPELKMCRRVSKIWNNISSEVLLKQDAFFINFRCFDNDSDFYKVTRLPLDKNFNLNGLNKLLENSSTFPCSDFKFMHGDLATGSVQKFFQLIGPQIKSLRLRCQQNRVLTSKSTFLHILQVGVPNVETLYLTNYEYPEEEDFPLFLPSLRRFRWVGCSATALKILRSAPNLKVIPSINFNDADLTVLKTSGQSSKVKECPSFRDSKYNKHLTKFANLSPQLRTIKIFNPDMDNRTGVQLDRILESSKDTLETLLMSEALVKTGVVIPTLRNLKTLTLMMGSGNRIFPILINLPVIFPSLHTIDCTNLFGCNDDHMWDKLFPPPDPFRGSLTTVQTLKIDSSSTELWMLRLQSLCPNFQNVVISNGSCSDFEVEILARVIKFWTHLKTIELVFSGSLENYDNFVMDSPITGLTSEICRQFHSDPRSAHNEQCLKKLVIGSSIRDLKELTSLRVQLIMMGGYDRLPFSCVSGIYAFKLMPNLKVIVLFDHHDCDNEWLQLVYTELADYVNIKHQQR